MGQSRDDRSRAAALGVQADGRYVQAVRGMKLDNICVYCGSNAGRQPRLCAGRS